MKTLGQQLKEENKAKEDMALRKQWEEQRLEEEAAKSEAKILFENLIKELPNRIKAHNKNGKRSMKVIEAGWEPNHFQFTKTQFHLMSMLSKWARENDLESFHLNYERYGKTAESFWIKWK